MRLSAAVAGWNVNQVCQDMSRSRYQTCLNTSHSHCTHQYIADHIEPAGSGAFMKILKERRAKLEQEGLFAKYHKQKLPYLPKKIGIITSISGSVIKDIIHRITDRCHTHLVIWPVAVQGESSADEVSNAIDEFNKLDSDQRPDLLIVARGGGSIEDLWSFNEENVVRSTYNSKIPIISAVGHETDYTLKERQNLIKKLQLSSLQYQ